MATKLALKWRCGECLEIHDSDLAAMECCAPDIQSGYPCPVCDAWHYKESAAVECCGFDENAPPPAPCAAELEAAGQMRLLP